MRLHVGELTVPTWPYIAVDWDIKHQTNQTRVFVPQDLFGRSLYLTPALNQFKFFQNYTFVCMYYSVRSDIHLRCTCCASFMK